MQFLWTNTDDSGPGSLRNAIDYVNTNDNPLEIDRIEFNIPGDETHTIQPLSPLPELIEPVIIDGYSQPGASSEY